MADLKTQYMGFNLPNPLVVASSGITGSIDGVRRCIDAGAGAVVLKSMFEELIIAESKNIERELIQSEHPEAYEYLRAELGMQLGPRPYLNFIEDVRRNVSVPVIASVNCISSKWWVSYAQNIEAAGAEGLELNISHFPQTRSEDSLDIEKRYVDIVHEVTAKVSIPVAVKIGFYFTSIWKIVEDIVTAGAKALVLFNRYHSIDVDIEHKTLKSSMTLSSPSEMLIPLRWTGFLAGRLTCDITATTGVYDSESIIKLLMVGATVVQLCSLLYEQGPESLSDLLEHLDSWLDERGYNSVSDIRGLAVKNALDKDILLKRFQYVKALEETSKYEY